MREPARPLSPRERAVLDLLLQGQNRSKIAEKLQVSPHTACSYVKDLFKHFGVHSHAQLIARFYQEETRRRSAAESLPAVPPDLGNRHAE